MISVNLTPSEIMQAASIGMIRHIQDVSKNRKNAYGLEDGHNWQIHIEGALGEFAVAKHLNIFWNGSIGNLKNSDVGKFEVRTAHQDNYRLILHPKDKDNSIFILVTGLNGKYIIRGWMYGYEGKNKKYWNDPNTGRPAYFIPQSELHTMEILPKIS